MAQKRSNTDETVDDPNKRSRQDEAPNGKLSIQEQIAQAKAKVAALAARRNTGAAPSTAPPAPSTQDAGQSAADLARARIEAIKARMQAATKCSSPANDAPPQRISSPAAQYRPTPPAPSQAEEDVSATRRAGLGIGLHPRLMGDAAPVREYGGRQKGRSQDARRGQSTTDSKANPYLDNAEASAEAPGRRSRAIHFSERGKYIAEAQKIRRQAQIEEMNRRIAEAARQQARDEDKTELLYIIKDTPDVEWWDLELLAGDDDSSKRYPDLVDDAMAAEKQLRITTEDSVITRYVQHPVLLEPPQDKHMPQAKPMYMTKKEMAKKRRQERSERLKEEQAKVRLGLAPPEPPKIKKSNLMRVLGEQAVKDPTAVEARVNREIEERRLKHEAANAERALSKDQQHEKLAANQQKDADKGIRMAVWRVNSLANGQHRYKIDINAKQNALTGITILNPDFCLVIVEGGPRSVYKYKKLMEQRIDWGENAVPTEVARTKEEQGRDSLAKHEWLRAEDEGGELKELQGNMCRLVWEGEVPDRQFKFWNSRVCEKENDAERILAKNKMENMWRKAKAL